MILLRSPHLHAALWIGLISVLMMVPADPFSRVESWLPLSLEDWFDKIQHFMAFLVMVVLLARSLREQGALRRPILIAALATLAVSFLLEEAQIVVPWRHFDVKDLVADTLGVLAGVLVARALLGRRPRPEAVAP